MPLAIPLSRVAGSLPPRPGPSPALPAIRMDRAALPLLRLLCRQVWLACRPPPSYRSASSLVSPACSRSSLPARERARSARIARTRWPSAPFRLPVLSLDAWLAHSCSRFFHRRSRTLRSTRSRSRISRLREKRRHRKYSRHRLARPHRVLRPFYLRGTRIGKVQVAHVDNPRQAAQTRKEVQHVEVRPIGLGLKRHLVMVFLWHDILRR